MIMLPVFLPTGPAIFLAGAVHGDEIHGVEIIRRILATRRP
jgi:predicted deacylase